VEGWGNGGGNEGWRIARERALRWNGLAVRAVRDGVDAARVAGGGNVDLDGDLYPHGNQTSARHDDPLELAFTDQPYLPAQDIQDGLLVGIGLLANSERLWGDRELGRTHWCMLKRMLVARGGFASLTRSRNGTMHTKLLWSFVALTGSSSYAPGDPDPAYAVGFEVEGLSLPWYEVEGGFGGERAESDGRVGSYGRDLDPRTALTLSIDEFCQLMAGRTAVCRRAWVDDNAFVASRPGERPEGVIKPGSLLYSCLARTTQDTGYANPDKRLAHEHCRMACLLYLNIVTAEFGNDEACLNWFAGVETLLEQDGEDSATSEHLLWLLLSEDPLGEGMDIIYQRDWKMARLMGVVKRSNSDSWNRVMNVMWNILVRENRAGWWDGAAFREEVKAHVQDQM
jgi:hypothetical protein